MSNTSLVFMSEDQTIPVTTSEVIATALDKDHKDVLALAKKYQADLNEFGVASFKTNLQTRGNRNGTQEKEIVILNEQQATLLITYMRNSDKVRKFKIALVKAFFEMREQIQEKKTSLLLEQAYQRGLLENKRANAVTFNEDNLNCALKTLTWLNSNRADFKANYERMREIIKQMQELKETLEMLWCNLEVSSRVGENEVKRILNQMDTAV